MTMEYYFAWWNLENLFDLEELQRSARIGCSAGSTPSSKGWNADVLDLKLGQLGRHHSSA